MKYSMILSEDNNHTFIEIQEGKYKGVVFYYGEVRFNEESEQLRIEYAFKIVKSPLAFFKGELEESVEFKSVMNDILNELLSDPTGEIEL